VTTYRECPRVMHFSVCSKKWECSQVQLQTISSPAHYWLQFWAMEWWHTLSVQCVFSLHVMQAHQKEYFTC